MKNKRSKTLSPLLLGVICFGFVVILSVIQSDKIALNIASVFVRFSLMFLGAYWLNRFAEILLEAMSKPTAPHKKTSRTRSNSTPRRK